MEWQRVMIIGNGGTGKSTVARELGVRLGLPVVHLDQLFWDPGWVAVEPAEFRRRLEPLAAAPAWVIEGNYRATFDLRLPRADVVVFLDLPRRVAIPSAVRRWCRHRGHVRPAMAEGCPEKFDREFLAYLWAFPRAKRPALLDAIDEAGATPRLVRLRSRREVRRWLATAT